MRVRESKREKARERGRRAECESGLGSWAMCRQMAHKAPVYRERIYLLCLKYLPSCAKKQRRGPHGQFWPRQHETIIVVASCSCTRRMRKITAVVAEGAATANKAEHSWTRCGRQQKKGGRRTKQNKTKQNRTKLAPRCNNWNCASCQLQLQHCNCNICHAATRCTRISL